MKSSFKKLGAPVLLAFAIAALPAVSHANSISNFLPPPASISSGNFISGTMGGTVANGNLITVSITGTLGTLTIRTGTLIEVVPGIFTFMGGTLTVKNAQGIFKDTLTSGSVLASGTGSFTIGAILLPTATLTSGSTSFDFGITNGMVSRGNAGVNFVGSLTQIPEPGTLGMLGTGLIGLVGMVRRKLNR